MNRRTRRRAVILAVVGSAVVLTACTPDTTRGRMEKDFTQTFSNQYAQSLQRQGKPVGRPTISSTECHNSSNQKQDSGPGSWGCEIKWMAPGGGKPHDDFWLVLSDALGCYQAFTTDDKLRYHKIRDIFSHKLIADPAGSFDGCLDVFSGPTNVSKK